MASVEKYKDTDGKERFAARWRHDGKQVKARKDPRTGEPFKNERAAKKYAEEEEADARRRMTPVRSNQTVTEYARYWASTREHRPTTKRRIELTIRTHLEPTALGRMTLGEVRQSQVQAWVTERGKVVAVSTLKIVLVGLLKAVFSSAVHDDLVQKTPVFNLKYPKAAAKAKFVPLTGEQVDALADAMTDRYAAMVITQAGLGLRIGELLALRVQDVDFLRRRVEVVWQFTDKPERDADGWPIRVDLKTTGSVRTLPLPAQVADVLAAHLAKYGAGADGSIFTTGRGRPLSPVYWHGYVFSRAVAQAGLPDGTTSHDLRHHFATELLHGPAEHRLSTIEVAALLGHEDASLVEKTYGHAPVDANERALAALDAAHRRRRAV